MNKSIIVSVVSLMVFAGCSHNVDLYEGPENTTSEEDINNNVKKVFGTDFASNQDWCTTTSGELTILTDASVSKVQLLVNVREVYDDVPSYVTRDALKLLNEAETNGRTSIKMSYDAPKENLGLYVLFVTNKGNIMKEVEGNMSLGLQGPSNPMQISVAG